MKCALFPSRRRKKVRSKDNDALKKYLEARKRIVDEALKQYVPGDDAYPPSLCKAVRYSIFAGGKRLRPILCMAAAEAVGGDSDAVLPVACALEMIHTYSLIHDDLPAMDDDEYRRGRLTNHKVFGEGMAILAGDALLTEAFCLMASGGAVAGGDGKRLLTVIHEIAHSAGLFGMVGGQAVDLESEGKEVDSETLHYIHTHKTAALLQVSLRAGAILAGGGPQELTGLTQYGAKIGLAFQIADDILDVEGDVEVLGKETGCDGERKKATYPALIGLEPSRTRARELVDEALTDLSSFDECADPLRMIARFIVDRTS